jgi:hypothetical protein
MDADVEFQQHLKSLAARGQAALTREERLKRQRSLDNLGVPSFYALSQVGWEETQRRSVDVASSFFCRFVCQ